MPFLGVQPTDQFASVAKQTITGTGATAYTLDHSVAGATDLAVFVNNVRQEPTVAYSATGTTITFTEALTSSDECYIIYIARTFLAATPPYDLATDSTGFFALPTGTTAQRPSSPADGYMRYNTDTSLIEVYHSTTSSWGSGLEAPASASGGTETVSGGYKYHTFTSSGTFTVTNSGEVDYLIVAGGGGGASGGGGAGGYLSGIKSVSVGTYTITVGGGGSSGLGGITAGTNGSDTSAFSLTAASGGGGGTFSNTGGNAGLDGGSGGGNGGADTGNSLAGGGSGTSGQGNDGGQGVALNTNQGRGGGGGASAAGANASGSTGGAGGAGLQWVNGSYYAGGGGGGGGTGAAGGVGGGGNGGDGGVTGVDASVNTGGGGGGGGAVSSTYGGAGGSGIVIIRYAI